MRNSLQRFRPTQSSAAIRRREAAFDAKERICIAGNQRNRSKTRRFISALLGVVCGAVIFALLPPLVLAQLIDLLTKKHTLWMEGILLYFGLLALTGLLESARESLLTVFGQKITHALRSSLMEKFGRLSANELNRQEPGALVSRFVGDVDTVENLFTSVCRCVQNLKHSCRHLGD